MSSPAGSASALMMMMIQTQLLLQLLIALLEPEPFVKETNHLQSRHVLGHLTEEVPELIFPVIILSSLDDQPDFLMSGSFRRVYPHKPDQKGESAMKLEVTVSEIADIFKEIQERPGQLFEMIRLDIREVVGKYLTAMMNTDLTHYLGREPHVRVAKAVNHRNGSYGRGFTLKGVGEVHVDIPKDRNGGFKTSVIPRSKQYEEEVARDFSILFLAGDSTRTLSMIPERLIGRRISPAEISSVNTELNTTVEA